jgi:hypothetical protein
LRIRGTDPKTAFDKRMDFGCTGVDRRGRLPRYQIVQANPNELHSVFGRDSIFEHGKKSLNLMGECRKTAEIEAGCNFDGE